MKRNILASMWPVAIWLTVIAVGLIQSAESKKEPPIRFQSFSMPTGSEGRVDAVSKAVDFQKWPQTEVRHVAPPIDKTLLSHPDLVTRQFTSYHVVPFGQVPWGECNWSWDRVVESTKSLPTELPAERKDYLLAKMPSEQRNDPNFVEEYLKRKLDRYKTSKKYRLEGEMDVYLCLAPSARAAQEYMLTVMTQNTMATEGVVMMYAGAKHPAGLGTISFLTESSKKDDIRIKYVRNNIFLNIRGNRCFAEEVLPLARKIDALIKKQPALTYQQLLARRPSISIASNAVKSTTDDHFTGLYNVSAPEGSEIASVKAYVDGESTWFEDGRIVIRGKKGEVKVKLTATTSELLTNTFERELIIPE